MNRREKAKKKERQRKHGVPSGVVALNKGQMAAALQISVRCLNGMMARGEIAYFKIGKLVRFRIEDALQRMGETILVAGEEEDTKAEG